jgi:hypothetical protein
MDTRFGLEDKENRTHLPFSEFEMRPLAYRDCATAAHKVHDGLLKAINEYHSEKLSVHISDIEV